jgi:hypothetical protein
MQKLYQKIKFNRKNAKILRKLKKLNIYISSMPKIFKKTSKYTCLLILYHKNRTETKKLHQNRKNKKVPQKSNTTKKIKQKPQQNRNH